MELVRSYLKTHTNPPVFLTSAVMVLLFVGWGVLAPGNLGTVANDIMAWISQTFGWWYILSVSGFLIVVLALLVSPYARMRIGKEGDQPEWSTGAWFSMLFTAGMGIGLVFFGVAEPIYHFNGPPTGEGGTTDAAFTAMSTTFFHWSLHPWAIYIVVGLSMAYFHYRHDLPLRPASAFYPLIGEGIHGWAGHLVDILAVFGTLFGLATSLGLGASQINAGLNQLFGLPVSAAWQVVIIAVVTAVAVGSVMLGLNAGVRRLSVLNMYLAGLLMLLVFLLGPSLFILNFMVGSTGHYLQSLPETSLRLFTFSSEGRDWITGWTLFYWAWWIAWSPFVGMFLARISKGRTIREFVTGCLLAPTGVSIAWFAVFGGSAINLLLNGDGTSPLTDAGTTDAMFLLFEQLVDSPAFAVALSLLGLIVVVLFFATSSDSGSLVVDMLTNGGDPHPIWQQRMFWAILEGMIAAILLMAGAAAGENALSALQTASVTSGLPFSIVLALMCWGLLRQLRRDWAEIAPQIGQAAPQPAE